jgi:hypothetical protein
MYCGVDRKGLQGSCQLCSYRSTLFSSPVQQYQYGGGTFYYVGTALAPFQVGFYEKCTVLIGVIFRKVENNTGRQILTSLLFRELQVMPFIDVEPLITNMPIKTLNSLGFSRNKPVIFRMFIKLVVFINCGITLLM